MCRLAPAIGGMDEALGMVRQAIKAVGLEGKVRVCVCACVVFNNSWRHSHGNGE